MYSKTIMLFVTIIFLGPDKNQIEAKGKVVYCRRGNSGLFNNGIKFQEAAEKNIGLIRALVRSYHYSKDKSQLKISPMIQMEILYPILAIFSFEI